MSKRWIRRPETEWRTIKWRQFYGKWGETWRDKRFYFQNGELPGHYAEEIAQCERDQSLLDGGLKETKEAVHIHGIIICGCGQRLELLSHWANSCRCGSEYDEFGGTLAHRSLWYS